MQPKRRSGTEKESQGLEFSLRCSSLARKWATKLGLNMNLNLRLKVSLKLKVIP